MLRSLLRVCNFNVGKISQPGAKALLLQILTDVFMQNWSLNLRLGWIVRFHLKSFICVLLQMWCLSTWLYVSTFLVFLSSTLRLYNRHCCLFIHASKKALYGWQCWSDDHSWSNMKYLNNYWMKFCKDIHGSPRINPTDFGKTCTFSLAPPLGWGLLLFSEMSLHLLNGLPWHWIHTFIHSFIHSGWWSGW